MTDDEIERWAAAYVEAQLDPNLQKKGGHPLWWAVDDFMIDNKPADDCWKAILEILKRRPSDEIIAGLAAGPLEDLINRHGPEFIDRIERHVRRDPACRSLLGGVWKSSKPEIWARVEKARGNTRW